MHIDRPEVIKGLTSISKIHPNSIESITLPLLFHNLPDHAPGLPDIDGREKYRSILGSLSELCVQPALFETLLIRITTKLDLLSSDSPAANFAQADDQGDVPMDALDHQRECNIAYAYDLLHTLSRVIDAKLEAKHVDVAKYFDKLVPRLHTLVVVAAQPRIGDVEPLFRDRRLTSIVARIAGTMMWELGPE